MVQDPSSQGDVAFHANDFTTALFKYTSTILTDPTNPAYRVKRSMAYSKLGR